MKHFFTHSLVILFTFFSLLSCTSDDGGSETDNNNDIENPDPGYGNNPSEGRYKVSFNAQGLNGNINYKVTYKFDNNQEVVECNGVKSGYLIGDANNRIDFWIEMVNGNTYLNLNQISFKIEDLQTGNIREINGTSGSNQYIISPDMLTEFSFLTNLYGYNVGNPKNNYKTHFYTTIQSNGFGSQYGGGGVSESNYYDYRNDVLVHKPTRGSIRIVVDNHQPPNGSTYYLSSVQNAWLIRENPNGPNTGFYNTLEATSTMPHNYFNSSIYYDKTYELILPSNMSDITLKFWGDNASATVYLMRKNGTTDTVEVNTANNEEQTINFEL